MVATEPMRWTMNVRIARSTIPDTTGRMRPPICFQMSTWTTSVAPT